MLTACTTTTTVDNLVSQREVLAGTDQQELRHAATYEFVEPLTLEEILVFAVDKNLAVRLKQFEDSIADNAFVEGQLGAIDLSWKFAANRKLSNDTTVPVVQNGAVIGTVPSPKRQQGIDLGVTVDVIDYLSRFVGIQESALAKEQRYLHRYREQQKFKMEVVNAYWRVVVGEQSLAYTQAIYDAVSTQLTVGQSVWGTIAVKEAELLQKQFESHIHVLASAVRNNMQELRRLMGLAPHVSFTVIDDSVEDFVSTFTAPEYVNADMLELFALRNRPELFSQDIDVILQREDARKAMLQLFPAVNVFLGHHRLSSSNAYEAQEKWLNAGFDISWNLARLPKQLSVIEDEKQRAQVLDAHRKYLSMGIIAQVHLGVLDYVDTFDKMRINNETAGLARELYELTMTKNALEGVLGSEVNQRLAQAFEAQMRYWESAVETIEAYGRLLYSSGNAVTADYALFAEEETSVAAVNDALIPPPAPDVPEHVTHAPEMESTPPVRRVVEPTELVQPSDPNAVASVLSEQVRTADTVPIRTSRADTSVDISRDDARSTVESRRAAAPPVQLPTLLTHEQIRAQVDRELTRAQQQSAITASVAMQSAVLTTSEVPENSTAAVVTQAEAPVETVVETLPVLPETSTALVGLQEEKDVPTEKAVQHVQSTEDVVSNIVVTNASSVPNTEPAVRLPEQQSTVQSIDDDAEPIRLAEPVQVVVQQPDMSEEDVFAHDRRQQLQDAVTLLKDAVNTLRAQSRPSLPEIPVVVPVRSTVQSEPSALSRPQSMERAIASPDNKNVLPEQTASRTESAVSTRVVPLSAPKQLADLIANMQRDMAVAKSRKTARLGRGNNMTVQLGAFRSEMRARAFIDRLTPALITPRTKNDAQIEAVSRDNETVYRVRFSGYTEQRAQAICEEWRALGNACWLLSPSTVR